jgi:Hydrophobic surface binding protein A
MRASTLLTALFTPAALARPNLTKRDLATVQAAFANISSYVTALDAGIQALTPSEDPGTAVSQLTALSQNVVDALTAGTASVTPTGDLSIVDAINLLSSSNTLVANVNSTVNDLIAQKAIVDAADADGTVVDQLTTQKGASQSFIAAVVSKVPSVEQSLANQQAQQVVTILNNGITAFGGTVSS